MIVVNVISEFSLFTSEMYSELCQTSKIEAFCENNQSSSKYQLKYATPIFRFSLNLESNFLVDMRHVVSWMSYEGLVFIQRASYTYHVLTCFAYVLFMFLDDVTFI